MPSPFTEYKFPYQSSFSRTPTDHKLSICVVGILSIYVSQVLGSNPCFAMDVQKLSIDRHIAHVHIKLLLLYKCKVGYDQLKATSEEMLSTMQISIQTN